jgi:outer membrane biosynthesis protein TonB
MAAGAGAAADADDRLLGLLSPKKRETFLKTLAGLAAAADEPVKTKTVKKPAPPKADKPPAKKKKKAKKTKDAKEPKEPKAAKTQKTPKTEPEATAKVPA